MMGIKRSKKKSPYQKDRQLTRPFGSGSNQPVSKTPHPLAPLRGSYIPREPEQTKPIPKLTKPKKGKKVRREFARSHQTIGDFLVKVGRYTKGCSQELEDTRVIEVLLNIFSRLPIEFQNRDDIRWFLASRLKDEFSELHIFLIADGVWKFILRHCKDIEEGTGGAATDKNEVIGLLPTNESEDQGAGKTAHDHGNLVEQRNIILAKAYNKAKVNKAEIAAATLDKIPWIKQDPLLLKWNELTFTGALKNCPGKVKTLFSQTAERYHAKLSG